MEKTHASVKKPAPDTNATLMWNHLLVYAGISGASYEGGIGEGKCVRELSIVNLCQDGATLLVHQIDAVILSEYEVVEVTGQ